MIAISAWELGLYLLARVNAKGKRAEATEMLLMNAGICDGLLELGLIRRGSNNAMAKQAGTFDLFFLTNAGGEKLWELGFCYAGSGGGATSSPQWRRRRDTDTQWNMYAEARRKQRQIYRNFRLGNHEPSPEFPPRRTLVWIGPT